MSAWAYLSFAILFEIVGTMLLKLSDGFEKPAIGTAAIAAYGVCFWFFAPALKTIPVGVAYAVWSGVGIAAAAALGAILFAQRLEPVHYLFIALIIAGAVGLNLTTGGKG